MTDEEKQLLFVDLCVRLPYGVIADFKLGQLTRIKQVVKGWWLDKINDKSFKFIKPYLRPLSSMTEKEKKEWMAFAHIQVGVFLESLDKAVDWLDEHHFDYRGLIEKGLALEALDGMYETE